MVEVYDQEWVIRDQMIRQWVFDNQEENNGRTNDQGMDH